MIGSMITVAPSFVTASAFMEPIISVLTNHPYLESWELKHIAPWGKGMLKQGFA